MAITVSLDYSLVCVYTDASTEEFLSTIINFLIKASLIVGLFTDSEHQSWRFIYINLHEGHYVEHDLEENIN